MFDQDGDVKKVIADKQTELNRLIEEVAEKERDIGAKRKRMESLRRFIEQANEFLGTEEEKSDIKTGPVTISLVVPQDSFGKSVIVPRAIEVLRAFDGGPMNASRIAGEFAKRGWPLTKNGREVVRTALKKKPELFVKHRNGSFSLRE